MNTTTEPSTEYQPKSDLGKAIATWENGDHIPTDLYMKLTEQGLDPSVLEKQYKSDSYSQH